MLALNGKTAYRKADDLGARFKVPEWRAFCHTARLRNRPPRLQVPQRAAGGTRDLKSHGVGELVHGVSRQRVAAQ